jgi:hypothetical protein
MAGKLDAVTRRLRAVFGKHAEGITCDIERGILPKCERTFPRSCSEHCALSSRQTIPMN